MFLHANCAMLCTGETKEVHRMANRKQENGLQIDDDLQFHRKESRAERVGWIGMVLLALAGLLGLFGDGPLAKVRAANGPVEAQYDRFERLLSPAQLEVQVSPEAAQNEEVRLQIGRELLDGWEIRDISPQPDRMELSPDRITYVFGVRDPSSPMRITFDIETARAGSHSGQIGLDGGEQIDVNQFVYP